MANGVYQQDINGKLMPQTSTNPSVGVNAADVFMQGGQVRIEQANHGESNAVAVLPVTDPAKGTLNATVAAYVASFQVKAGPGKLYGMTGYNSKGSAQWVQVFDSLTLPAEGAVPAVTFTVATVANFAIDFGIYGRTFKTGIYVVNSSTGPTKTIGSADIWLDAQYL